MKRSLVLLAVPLAFLGIMAAMRLAQGEFWRAPTFDPDYAYLLNAQNLAERRAPGHFDHPGTPVQVFGGAILSVMKVPRELLLKDPEFYLTVLAWSCCLLLAVALWWFGWVALKGGASMRLVVLAQTAPLISAPILFDALMRFNPEPVLMALGIGIVAMAIRGDRSPDWRTAMVCGVLAGVAVASKMNFLGVAIGLLLLFGIRTAVVYTVTLAVVTTIMVVPIWPHLAKVFSWASHLAFNADAYGSGNLSAPVWRRIWTNIPTLLQLNPVLAAAILIGVRAWWMSRRMDGAASIRWRRTLLAFEVALLLQLVMSAKFDHARYIAPALTLTGGVILVAQRLAPLPALWRYPMLALVIAAFSMTSLQHAKAIAGRNADYRELEVAIRDEASDCLEIGSYPTSSPRYALAFGNFYAAYLFSDTLRSLYTGFVEHNAFDNVYREWDRVQTVHGLFWRRGCAIERGIGTSRYVPPEGTRVARELIRRSDALRILESTSSPSVCEIRYGDGWHGWEVTPDNRHRWAGQEAFIVVASPLDTKLTIAAQQSSITPGNRVEARWNGKPPDTVRHNDTDGVQISYTLPVRKGWNRLALRSANPAIPSSNEGRRIAFRWSNVTMSAPNCTVVE